MQITWVRFDKILSTIGYRYACVYWVRWQSNGKYGRELRASEARTLGENLTQFFGGLDLGLSFQIGNDLGDAIAPRGDNKPCLVN